MSGTLRRECGKRDKTFNVLRAVYVWNVKAATDVVVVVVVGHVVVIVVVFVVVVVVVDAIVYVD